MSHAGTILHLAGIDQASNFLFEENVSGAILSEGSLTVPAVPCDAIFSMDVEPVSRGGIHQVFDALRIHLPSHSSIAMTLAGRICSSLLRFILGRRLKVAFGRNNRSVT